MQGTRTVYLSLIVEANDDGYLVLVLLSVQSVPPIR
jgi:hypothetical protein